MADAIHFILHLDASLAAIVAQYGLWTYALLFAIIFCETGLVLTPFLPGDSLLFAAGALAGIGALDPWALWSLLALAAIGGDNLNYLIGSLVGPAVFEHSRYINRRHLDRTREFYATHGGKTLVLARFLPILRTFAPFVAGVARMRYPYFLACSIGGGMLWTGLFTGAGYFFGNLPVVKSNFSLVVLVIIVISLVPAAMEALRARRQSRTPEAP